MFCVCCGNNLVKTNNTNKWVYYRCKKCGYWTSRSISGDFPKYDYNDTPTYDENANNDWDAWVNTVKKIMQYKFRLTDKLKAGRFLDVGCSEGVYVAACESMGWEAIGYEIDSTKVDRAQSKGLNVRGPNDFHLDESSVDFILLRHVIEHVPNFLELITFSSRYLKIDGIMCIEIPNQAGIIAQFLRRSIREGNYLGHVYPPKHVHAFEPKTLYYVAARVDMKCEKVYTYSPADPKWSVSVDSKYKNIGSFLRLAHWVLSKIGYGENIVAFFKQGSR